MLGLSLYARLAGVLLFVALAVGLWWKADRMLAKADAQGYERRAAEDHAAAELQRETNRGTARKAEVAQAAQAEIREKFLVITATEVHREAASLAACPLPDPLRVRFNAAAECAGSDRPAACGPDEPVRQP